MKELQSLEDVFNKKLFRIPDYQRGYAWGKKQLVEFWEDLISLDERRSHYTGVLSIKEVPEETSATWNDELWLLKRFTPYFIVDGQQRLTTVSIFLQCLVEAVKSHPDNKGISDDDIFLGDDTLSEVIKNYIVVTEPKHRITKAYKFGYEANNPSFEFLRYRIFNEESPGTLTETFYTLNLENAKVFFNENIAEFVKSHGIDALSGIYEKLTQKFLFNLYEIDDNFDVFVAFETMNNRGKKLSDLELLKNRLIYLTTLYTPEEVKEDVKETIRKKINDTWGEIYNQLGRNKKAPLNDDDFLRAHWVMYFKYSRVKGNDYIRFLLDGYFSPKSVFEKLEVTTNQINNVEELVEEIDSDDDDSFEEFENESTHKAKLTIKDISDYVDSLKSAAKYWYAAFFPSSSDELTSEEKIMMDKINRVKIGYFRPLIMALFLRTQKGAPERIKLLNAIERFIFIAFRLCRAQSNYRSSSYYRLARTLYTSGNVKDTLLQIHNEIEQDLAWTIEEDGSFKTSHFETFINKKFGPNGEGFYAWNDLRYFLFEYEEELKKSRGVSKFDWKNFIAHEKDKVSIEHIYPQTPKSDYWLTRFEHCTDEQKRYLKGSLGNLLPLSLSVNIKLQNDDFPDKKNTRRDEKGSLIRSGYNNGSYSELEVAELGKDDEWTPERIKERGLTLLKFMETRWQLDMGSSSKKLALLHLSFMDDSITSGSEEVALEGVAEA
ncbi:DUF262 domain-containing HNH endonuclease family protein [Pseudoalteromonas sp. BZB3]|uniref:DUF262 domain-containing protein n=1 Tax=Pseudoalteromonas sp. BZB3 TaxID=3136670 RepID=UPI0032C4421D